MIAIREYRETDCERMLSLIRELQAHEVALYDRMKPTADMGHWYIDLLKKQCAEDDGVILIAEEDGKALAYATILTNVVEDGEADAHVPPDVMNFASPCLPATRAHTGLIGLSASTIT